MNTPLAIHFKLSTTLSSQSNEEEPMSRISCASVVGNIMYAINCTYPIISKAIVLLIGTWGIQEGSIVRS